MNYPQAGNLILTGDSHQLCPNLTNHCTRNRQQVMSRKIVNCNELSTIMKKNSGQRHSSQSIRITSIPKSITLDSLSGWYKKEKHKFTSKCNVRGHSLIKRLVSFKTHNRKYRLKKLSWNVSTHRQVRKTRVSMAILWTQRAL